MTRSASPKLAGYVTLAALGLLGALVFELPELAAVAAPFALVAALGIALATEPALAAAVSLERGRVLEGDEVGAVLALSSPTGGRFEVYVRLAEGLAVAEGANPSEVRLGRGGRRELALRLRADRWGAYGVGDVFVRAWAPFRLFRYEARLDAVTHLKAYPRPERVGALLGPEQTQVLTGNYVARERGEGIEFADLRPFASGDRVRRVNWRASARRGELWVNEYHPERNADVVVFLDSFASAGGVPESTLDRAVRAASALVSGYLRHKDRVGFVAFGGRVNWLQPQGGTAQLYRVVDALLDTEIVLNYAWRGLAALPRQTLPPKALVIALTPLLDERVVSALLDLPARGFDLAVVEVSPLPFVTVPRDPDGELAYRIWRLRRDAMRSRFERVGVSVGIWSDEAPFAVALEEVRTYRRSAARARA